MNDYLKANKKSDVLNFVSADIESLVGTRDEGRGTLNELLNDRTVVLVLETANEHGMAEQRDELG